jgi:hypothetical protein
MAAGLLAVSRATPLRRAYALYLAGDPPAIVVLLTIAFACLLAPAESTAGVMFRIVPPLLLVMLLWGSFMTYACFRSGLGLPRSRAVIAAGIHFFVLVALVLSYFLAMGQLGPQLWV